MDARPVRLYTGAMRFKTLRLVASTLCLGALVAGCGAKTGLLVPDVPDDRQDVMDVPDAAARVLLRTDADGGHLPGQPGDARAALRGGRLLPHRPHRVDGRRDRQHQAQPAELHRPAGGGRHQRRPVRRRLLRRLPHRRLRRPDGHPLHARGPRRPERLQRPGRPQQRRRGRRRRQPRGDGRGPVPGGHRRGLPPVDPRPLALRGPRPHGLRVLPPRGAAHHRAHRRRAVAQRPHRGPARHRLQRRDLPPPAGLPRQPSRPAPPRGAPTPTPRPAPRSCAPTPASSGSARAPRACRARRTCRPSRATPPRSPPRARRW